MVWLLLALAAQPSLPRDGAVELAIRTLAAELSIPQGAVKPAGASAITWPDSGLGCSDESREDEPTPGFRVLLMVEGSLYRVHVGAGRAVVCGKPFAAARESPAVEAPEEEPEREEATVDPALAPLIETVRKDLARRLQVEVDAIEVVEAKAVVWPDGGLGCPKEGMVYPQVLVDGAFVRLRYDEQTYDYHSGGSRKPFLCEEKQPD